MPPTSVLHDLGRRARRRPHVGRGRQRARRAALHVPGVDGARRHAERHRHPEARRRLHRADPRAAEPRHADGDRARNRRRVLPGADEHRTRRRLPASRHADRPPHREPRDHRPLRRRRRSCCCSSAAASPLSGSGGSRETARRARVTRAPPAPRSPPLPPARRTSAAACRSASRSQARGCSRRRGGSPVPASVPEDVRRRRARRRAQHPRDRRRASAAASAAPSTRGSRRRRQAVFLGRLVRGTDPAASFRPHIGCVPASGGGQRCPTSLHVYPPGKPTLPEMTEIPVRPGHPPLRRALRRAARGSPARRTRSPSIR